MNEKKMCSGTTSNIYTNWSQHVKDCQEQFFGISKKKSDGSWIREKLESKKTFVIHKYVENVRNIFFNLFSAAICIPKLFNASAIQFYVNSSMWIGSSRANGAMSLGHRFKDPLNNFFWSSVKRFNRMCVKLSILSSILF
jgi:hypothetical protein